MLVGKFVVLYVVETLNPNARKIYKTVYRGRCYEYKQKVRFVRKSVN